MIHETVFSTAMMRKFKPVFDELNTSGRGGIIFDVTPAGIVRSVYLPGDLFDRLNKHVAKLLKEKNGRV